MDPKVLDDIIFLLTIYYMKSNQQICYYFKKILYFAGHDDSHWQTSYTPKGTKRPSWSVEHKNELRRLISMLDYGSNTTDLKYYTLVFKERVEMYIFNSI